MRRRLTGLITSVTEQVVSLDVHGNQTVATTAVDRDDHKITRTVTYPDSETEDVTGRFLIMLSPFLVA